jgi:hypothetical protein
MHRVDGMHEQRGSSGRTQSRCDLASNDAALAHARDHYSPGAGVDQLDGVVESRSHGARNPVGQRAQGLSLDPDDVFANLLHGKKTDVSRTWRSALGTWQLALRHTFEHTEARLKGSTGN